MLLIKVIMAIETETRLEVRPIASAADKPFFLFSG
jgi:hypothetical protein